MDVTKQRKIQNKTAIITGSSRGIGREIALQLAENVRNLVVSSRNQHEINSVVKEIENVNNQVNVLGSKCDVRESFQVNSLTISGRQVRN
jgi:3-oxoacyl-[acyl-carrier protein] reductase